MYLIPPVFVVLAGLGKEPHFARGGARDYRLKLWVVAVTLIPLALDFAVLGVVVRSPRFSPWYFASDAAVVLVPLLFGMLARHTLWDLWVLACLAGLIGVLAVPMISVP